METNKFNGKFVAGLTMVAAMGGLLFGYDWVVIGGAKPFYERFFDITQNDQAPLGHHRRNTPGSH